MSEELCEKHNRKFEFFGYAGFDITTGMAGEDWRCPTCEWHRLETELTAAQAERDDLRAQVAKLTGERDAAKTTADLLRNALAAETTEHDSYGVEGSDFYRCAFCEAESGAGVFAKGIPHADTCLLKGESYEGFNALRELARLQKAEQADSAESEYLTAENHRLTADVVTLRAVLEKIEAIFWGEHVGKSMGKCSDMWRIAKAALASPSPGAEMRAAIGKGVEALNEWFAMKNPHPSKIAEALAALSPFVTKGDA